VASFMILELSRKCGFVPQYHTSGTVLKSWKKPQ
jgi:glutathione peroxidase-family protein